LANSNRGAPDFFKATLLFGMGPEGVPVELRADEEGNLRVNIIPHHVTHEAGGSDEISVEGLKGVLANLQFAKWSVYDVRANFPTSGLEAGALGYATDEGVLYRWNGSAWEKVLTCNFLNLTDTPASYSGKAGYVLTVNQDENGVEFRSSAPPEAHADTHQAGGSDEIDVTGLSGELADHQKAKLSVVDSKANFPAAGIPGRLGYATDEGILYRDTGSDWVKAAVKDYPDLDSIPSEFNPQAHASRHEEGGSDAIDPANIGANWDKIVNKPSCFTPCTHASTHQPGGSDALPTGAPAPITEGATGAEGSSTALARADHVHETPSEWTPKEHGNEAHNPGFLALDGSNSPTADIDWGERGIKECMFLLGLGGGIGEPTLDEMHHNVLAYVDKWGSVTVSPAPTSGSIGDAFDLRSSTYSQWDSSVSLPVTVEIDLGKSVHHVRVIGVQFYWIYYISGVKIEYYSAGDLAWHTLVNKTANTEPRVLYVGDLVNVRKLRYTFSGSYNSDKLRLMRLFALSVGEGAYPQGHYLDREGLFPMQGDLNMNGNDIVNPGLVDGVDVSSHASRHQNGGADELSVGKLEGIGAPGAQVFDGNAPTDWTDLDLSSVVGARRALVFLKVKNNSTTDARNYAFRPNGDSDDYYAAADFHSCSACRVTHGDCGTALVITDTSGIIEWKEPAGDPATIWVWAYIALN